MTPDAVDYLAIARNRVEGRGWTMPIKWHWFYEAPVEHSAFGERSLGWPMVARWAVLFNPTHPGIPAQVLNVILIGLAAVAWGAVAMQAAGSIIAGGLCAAFILTSATIFTVTVTPLSEPLALLLMGLLALVLSPRRSAKITPPLNGVLAGFLTVALYLTRPSGPIIVLAVLIAIPLSGAAGRWKTLTLWALITVPLLALWHFAVWRAWGDPFHSLSSVHMVCMNITNGMVAGWGREWPTAGAFFAEHWREIALKWGEHLQLHSEALIAPGAFGLLSPLLALVVIQLFGKWREWSILWLLAIGHWVVAVGVWATTEPARLTLPTFVCLLPLVLAAGAWLIWSGGENRKSFIAAAVVLCTAALLVNGASLYLQAKMMSDPRMGAHPAVEQPVQTPVDYSADATVCTDSPFRLAYRSDLACVVFPFDFRERENLAAEWERFIEQYHVTAFALSNPALSQLLAPMIDQGKMTVLNWPDPEFIWIVVNSDGYGQ